MKAIYKALAAFQQEVPTIKKNSSGYGYKFADLEEINNVIKPLLSKNGLGYVQPIEGTAIKTIIFHVESGETIESSTDIPQGVQLAKMNDFQVLGSAITYLRRYSLSSMLGLVTDEDADASGEQTSKPIASQLKDKTAYKSLQEDNIRSMGKQLGYEDRIMDAKIATIMDEEQATTMMNNLTELIFKKDM